MSQTETREKIKELLLSIDPLDSLEEKQIQDAITWIDSGAEIYRIERPAKPPKHMVVYIVLHDSAMQKILLLNHTSSGLILPSGGHADLGELPYETAKREMMEEMKLDTEDTLDRTPPFFLTQVDTVGKLQSHRDVDLWYVYELDSTKPIDESAPDFEREYDGYEWMTYDQILATPIENLDEHMHRFVKKLHKNSTR